MKTSDFLTHLKDLEVKLWVEAGQLKVSAPKGVLTAELRAELVGRKGDLVKALEAASQPLVKQSAAEAAASTQAMDLAPRDVEYPPSFAQMRLWFLQQLDPVMVAYNIPMGWTLKGRLDLVIFERAFAEIIRRHEVLRTYFPQVGGKPVQRFDSGHSIRILRTFNEKGLSIDERREEVHQEMLRHVSTPFDLTRGPLLRAWLLEIDENEHVFFVSVHHILFDGLSVGYFQDELITLYEAFSAGSPSPLTEPKVQYLDFTVWQRAHMSDAYSKELMGYWKEVLGGKLPVLDLPADRARPAIQTFNGSHRKREFSAELAEKLRDLAQREGVTSYMLLLAAYKTLLHRFTGLEDLIVGSAINARAHPDVEEAIGFFANTMVLRTSVEDDPTFHELLMRVRHTVLGAFEHKDVPFERLVDELDAERNLSYSPIFQTLFLVEEQGEQIKRMNNISIEPVEMDCQRAQIDVTMWVCLEQDIHYVWAEYNTDLFDSDRIDRMLEHYSNLLEAVVENADCRLSELPLMGVEERGTLNGLQHMEETPFPELPIHQRFEAQVDAAPEAQALVFPSLTGKEDLELTYAELDAHANRLAHHLIAEGVQPDTLVGLCIDRSLDMIVTQLAIQKAGAAYVPLDPSYPIDRLSYMIEDSGLTCTVTVSAFARLIPDGVRAVCLDTETEAIAARSSDRPGLAITARARSYVIYTSGSTGRPKGVELEHRSVSNFLSSMAKEPGLGAGESLLALTTLSFDISVLETMLPLMVGATVIIAPREATTDGGKLIGLLKRLRPQMVQATPSTWHLLMISGWEGDRDLRVLSGGEALAPELAEELLSLVGQVWNMYGPTETTIWSTVKRIEDDQTRITIGHPIDNTRVYVLDKHLRQAPIGVPGELWIAGSGLARGYLNRPELTDERFVDDPYQAGQKMYCTGDLGRWLSDGDLECLGRVDTQVKLRGYRIELGEIESVLVDTPGIENCACVVREDTPGDQRLVAYCVTYNGAELDPEPLRSSAREKLPGYMVPSSFIALESLPLTPNGKLDRNALLKEEASQQRHGREEYVEPRSSLEREIAGIWGQSLQLEKVSVDVNFFDLGGHSLLLAEVHSKLQNELGAETLSIIELFQYPTVESLATYLDTLGISA